MRASCVISGLYRHQRSDKLIRRLSHYLSFKTNIVRMRLDRISSISWDALISVSNGVRADICEPSKSISFLLDQRNYRTSRGLIISTKKRMKRPLP